MKITYNLTVDDIVAFNCYHMQRSPAVRRTQRIYTWGVPAVALAASAPLSWSGVWSNAPIWLGVWSAAYLGIRLLTPPQFFARRLIRRMINKQGRNTGLIGPQELELRQEGILARNASQEQKVPWAGIERVVQMSGYTFVYISAVAALVIPQRDLLPEDYRRFVDELLRRCPSHQ